jgi:hypothetical protein
MPKTLNQKRSRSAHPNTNTRPKSRKSKAARCAINVLISLEQDVRSTTNAERCEINVLTVPTCAPERQPNLKRRTRAAKPDLQRRQGNRKLLTINRRRKATARGWMESDEVGAGAKGRDPTVAVVGAQSRAVDAADRLAPPLEQSLAISIRPTGLRCRFKFSVSGFGRRRLGFEGRLPPVMTANIY